MAINNLEAKKQIIKDVKDTFRKSFEKLFKTFPERSENYFISKFLEHFKKYPILRTIINFEDSHEYKKKIIKKWLHEDKIFCIRYESEWIVSRTDLEVLKEWKKIIVYAVELNAQEIYLELINRLIAFKEWEVLKEEQREIQLILDNLDIDDDNYYLDHLLLNHQLLILTQEEEDYYRSSWTIKDIEKNSRY